MPKKHLGKGLEALISAHSTERDDRQLEGSVSINQIIPNQYQPRQEFNEEEMSNLAKSIKRNGVLQPLTVREKDDGKYELIAGERRLRAALSAGLTTVPVYILSIEADVEMMEYALIENVQRVDLNSIEEAEGYAMLSGKYHLSHEEIAERVGKSRPSIANSLRLLKLPPSIKTSLKKREISAGHARSILSLKKSIQMMTLFQKIIREKLSVRQTENFVKKIKNQSLIKSKPKKIKKIDSLLIQLENQLISLLGTKVVIEETKRGRGKIYIDFYNEEDLHRIIEVILHDKD